jgi:hypothetical protein
MLLNFSMAALNENKAKVKSVEPMEVRIDSLPYLGILHLDELRSEEMRSQFNKDKTYLTYVAYLTVLQNGQKIRVVPPTRSKFIAQLQAILILNGKSAQNPDLNIRVTENEKKELIVNAV